MTNIPWLKKIVVLTLENRSFDQVLGAWPEVDGIPYAHSVPYRDGRQVSPFPLHRYSVSRWLNPHRGFDAMHQAWNAGAMDGFLEANDGDVMGYYRTDLWEESNAIKEARILDHYFSSVMGPAFPNRLYLISGECHSQEENPPVLSKLTFHQETVFDQLSSHGIDWRYYVGPKRHFPFYAQFMKERLSCPLWWFPRFREEPLVHHIRPFEEFFHDIREDTLPPVSFLSAPLFLSATPPLSLRRGVKLAIQILKSLQQHSSWQELLYVCHFDSSGGFYDHVPPLKLDHYGPGFRVPALLWGGQLSPAIIQTRFDHTSLLRLIEEQFTLPLLGQRTRRMHSLALALAKNPIKNTLD